MLSEQPAARALEYSRPSKDIITRNHHPHPTPPLVEIAVIPKQQITASTQISKAELEVLRNVSKSPAFGINAREMPVSAGQVLFSVLF